ncbi:MAG: winged helix-turn-helix transcriptional regulator [Clostridia bacterium]|nr:winged helix-turn-helix transcriptional regulator [Clostridia bacterium]
MERDYAAEIDALQQQMAEVKDTLTKYLPCITKADTIENLAQLASGQNAPNPTVGHVEKMGNMHPHPEISAILSDLEDSCGQSGSSGRITYIGVFASGGRQSTWVKNDLNTDGLLSLIENRTAEKMLACIGSNDRLNMLLAILRKPRTVAELVSDCGFSSTGQVYHHLKPLLMADLVIEDKKQRGSYIIQPHRVQGVIMLLAGIADLVDTTYTQGAF